MNPCIFFQLIVLSLVAILTKEYYVLSSAYTYHLFLSFWYLYPLLLVLTTLSKTSYQ